MSDFVRSPPSWLVVILIAILTAHAINKLIEIVTKRRNQNGLIPILELFIVLVLSLLSVHAYYEAVLTTAAHHSWYDRPFALVVALVFFGLGSMILYAVSRKPHPTRKRRR